MQQQPDYNVQLQPVYPAVQPIYPAVPQPIAPQVMAVVPVQTIQFGTEGTNVTCPNCGAKVITTTRYKSGLLAWLLCGLSLLVGCWAGCCLIPFCIDRTRDVEHFCPQCKALLGVHKRL